MTNYRVSLFVATITLLALASIVDAQTFHHVMGSNIPLTTVNDTPACIERTSTGGYIIAGTWYKKGDWCGAVQSWSAYLSLINPNGTPLWTRGYYFSPTNDWIKGSAVCVANDSTGGFVMVGTDRFANSTATGSHSSIYVLRTDPAGNPLWAKSYDDLDDTNYDHTRVQIKNCVTQMGAPDGFIICGATTDNVTGGIGTQGSGILLRIDNLGNQLWKRSYAHGNNMSSFKDVEQIEDGKYLVTGWAHSDSFVASPANCNASSLEKREAILVKIGSTGAVEWWKQYSHPLTPTGEPVGLNCGLSLLVRSESICVVGDYVPFSCDPGQGNIELFSVRPDGNMNGPDGWIRHFPYTNSMINSPGSRSLRQVGSDLVFQCNYSSISNNYWSAALIRLDGDANVIGGQEFGNSEHSYPASLQSTGFVTEPGGGFTLVSKAWNGLADIDNRVLRTNSALSSGCLENSITPTTITPSISVVTVQPSEIIIADIGNAADRNLLEYSINWHKTVICHSSTCVPDIAVTCGGGGGGSVELSWSPPSGSVSYVEVNRNGELIAVVDGTSFIDSPPSGQYHYELGFFNNDASCEPSVSSCEMLVGDPQPVGAITDLIVHATSLSPDEIADCLNEQLQEMAREPLKVSNLDLLSEQLGAELTEHTTIVWLMLGEYPYQQPISESNQVKLVEFLLGGGSLYIEGADVGFTISDQLAELAGVSAVAPGFFDGVVNQLSGSDSGYGLDFSELSAEYVGAGEFVDYLAPQGAGSGVVFKNTSASDHITAVYHDASFSGGFHRVVTSSTILAGYIGDQYALVDKIVGALGTPPSNNPEEFIRGDGNVDGLINIGDAIFGLNYLFGGTPSICLDAQDTNDDGSIDIGDPISTLGFLFSGGESPSAPFPGCGEDPTSDTLNCSGPASCP